MFRPNETAKLHGHKDVSCGISVTQPAAPSVAPQEEKKPEEESNVEKAETELSQGAQKAEIHAQYLMEKYVARWRLRMWKVPGVPLKLTQTTWLQQAMFSPSSQSARQTATRVIEYMAQVPARRKEIVDMLSG